MTQITADRKAQMTADIKARITADAKARIIADQSAEISVRGISGNLRIDQRQSAFTRGQSTLEYILVLSALLVAIIAVTLTSLRPGVESMMNDSAAMIQAATTRVQTELGLPPPTSGTTPTSPPGSGTPGSGQPPTSTNPVTGDCLNGGKPPCDQQLNNG